MMGTPRIWRSERWRRQVHFIDNKIRIVLYGAGRRGMALASLLEQGFPKTELIGFIDDTRCSSFFNLTKKIGG